MCPPVDFIVDASVHPNPRHEDDLRDYMEEPWRSQFYPHVTRYFYPAPTGIAPYGEYLEEAREDDGLPASDPAKVSADLGAMGVSHAILLPLTRGLIETDHGNQICAATNRWLADVWLEGADSDRYSGTIRVNPEDPERAVREIEYWAQHPKMVQVGVTLESHMPYGQRVFGSVWEAAARHNLPVVVHRDIGGGLEFHPTSTGYPVYHVEYNSLYSLAYIYHLSSLIAEGVFERLESLRFVFADGGLDLLTPLIWRMDADWIPSRNQVPWVSKPPSEYLAEHVRFCTAALEATPPEDAAGEWLGMSRAETLLMYGSSYPHWSTVRPGDVLPDAAAQVREHVLGGNARSFYGLAETAVRS